MYSRIKVYLVTVARNLYYYSMMKHVHMASGVKYHSFREFLSKTVESIIYIQNNIIHLNTYYTVYAQLHVTDYCTYINKHLMLYTNYKTKHNFEI